MDWSYKHATAEDWSTTGAWEKCRQNFEKTVRNKNKKLLGNKKTQNACCRMHFRLRSWVHSLIVEILNTPYVQ